MSCFNDDEEWYRQEEAMLQFEAEIFHQASEENIKSYLGQYGDAITQRIEKCKKSSERLIQISEYGAALICAFTGMEILIKHLIVLPILHGALLQNQIADILVSKILFDKNKNYKDLFQKILELYNIKLNTIDVDGTKKLWKTINEEIVQKRNLVVHIGEECSKEDVELAIRCLSTLQLEVVSKIASKLGFSIERTGKWSLISYGDSSNSMASRGSVYYEPKSPFKRKLS